MNENETLSAILADYRADIPAMTSGELPHPTPEYLRILLDSIEAAADRMVDEYCAIIHEKDEAYDQLLLERDKAIKARTPSNAAALREALEKFLDLARRGLALFTSYRYTEAENNELEDAFANAQSALATPARNCDMFRDWTEARGEWSRLPLHGIEQVDFGRWLFAPAEGGDHA